MTMAIPELRARAVDELSRTIDVIAQVTAKRTGHDPGDFAVRNLVGAIIGVILSATMPWAESHHTADMFARVDAALAHLEAGLPL
jgi:MftR C-terminal domain